MLGLVSKRDEFRFHFNPGLWDQHLPEITRLRRQLTPDSPVIDRARIQDVYKTGFLVVAVTAKQEADIWGEIVGIATLSLFSSLTRRCGHVDDVVVDSRFRGRGIGRDLLELIITQSREAEINQLELTSKTQRVEAIRLYESLGFKRRETNVLRLTL